MAATATDDGSSLYLNVLYLLRSRRSNVRAKVRANGRKWPDGCLWALAPQSCLSPKCAAYPTATFGEHWEPRLSATFRLSSDAAGGHLSVEFTLDNRRS
jgi:hypothetical protein